MPGSRPVPMLEFHVSRAARERYGLEDALFSLGGNVVLANFPAVRALARRMNERRAAATPPEPPIAASDLNALGLIDEVMHFVVARFQRERDPGAMVRALEAVERDLGRATLDRALSSFAEAFPNSDVHRRRLTADAWLAGETGGVPHRALALEELLMLALANDNPATATMHELFDDSALAEREACRVVVASLERWLATRPRYGPFDQPLVEMLRSPVRAHPDSLAAQLDYIRRHWGHLLGDLLLRLLTGLDVLAEEEHARWLRAQPGDQTRRASGRDAVPDFAALEHESERFSRDLDWMPRVVLIAKSVHVWLDQLARAHHREVRRLDQVPEEELDRLARWGINGLWLIGVWERSRASQRIKQLCGNPDAAASAYSLHDYRIADELGGEAALARLREQAAARGIRIASDMVPNHMGIDSRWVVEHPQWFLSLFEPPYPGYAFDGPDLSSDDRVSIQIEDHYYSRTDAAVVFKRTDRATGETRFIYHGNDGTSTPWNDTAQLDYLNPEVREGVIQTILHVARQFPIIRFDAAMTLAKRHYHRLWFPEPGTGGAIPSRAERGLDRARFDAAMPREFWREVVDRVAAEAPDTLLLAEAFWLMEGYFVRSLGMHRVYNSAFMNMLRDEQNANFRSVLKNTLEFDPGVLKRYVNFMSNPDERTAADQFGKHDKYFGVCALMATLPGLPMFGHGQIEGLEERYGMEYRRAYRDEQPDPGLVGRHEREIFPLLHRRRLFAEVESFLLYDFFDSDGHVNEDVIAYSNRHGEERALVVYNNRYAEAAGWIHTSVSHAQKDGGGRRLVQRSLGEGLGLGWKDGVFCRFREFLSGLEYVRSSRDVRERGLELRLGAYGRQVFVDFAEVASSERDPWATLARELGGRGVPSLDDALDEIRRRPLTEPFGALLERGTLQWLAGARERGGAGPAESKAPATARGMERLERLDAIEARMRGLLEAASGRGFGAGEPDTRARRARERIERWIEWAAARAGREDAASAPAIPRPDWNAPRTWGVLLALEALRSLADLSGRDEPPAAATGRVREWRLDRALGSALERVGLDSGGARHGAELALALFAHVAAFEEAARQRAGTVALFASWLDDEAARRALGVHTHEGVEWFRQEAFEEWLALLDAATMAPRQPAGAAMAAAAPRASGGDPSAAEAAVPSRDAWLEGLVDHARRSGWRIDRLLAAREPRKAPISPLQAPPDRG